MNPALQLPATPRPVPGPSRPESRSTPGFTDALGERFVEFDVNTSTSVERLRFKPEFAESAAFESALRDRIDRFEYFRHPAIATARSASRTQDGALVLESKHTAGRRLSELSPTRSSAMALDVIRQVTPALVALHEAGDDMVHGLFGAERIVVTREGRMVLVEHVLGSAMAALRLPAARLRTDFGLALPNSPQVITLDQADDLTELGLVVLSLLLGRRVHPSEYPDRIEQLVGESAQGAEDLTPESAWLRRWVERAVRVGPNPFASAREAVDTIAELSDGGKLATAARTARVVRAVPDPVPAKAVDPPAEVRHSKPEEHPAPAPAPAPVAVVAPVPAPAAVPTGAWQEYVETTPVVTTPIAVATMPAVAAAPTPIATPRAVVAAADSHRPAAAKDTRPVRPTPRRWLVPGLAAVALSEAAVIAGLMLARPQNVAAVPAVTHAEAPAPAQPAPTPPPVVEPPPVTRQVAPEPTRPAPTEAAVPAAERFGGVKVTTPFELQVFEGPKLLGVTAGPIALLEGSHALDLVNEAFEFKSHVTANVKPGQLTPITVTAPQGKISINAVPWADVIIDGTNAGQTPLANLSVAIGQHEIVFRHPQLGELHQTAVVKAVTPTRISVTFPK
jgi:hypothetical protein